MYLSFRLNFKKNQSQCISDNLNTLTISSAALYSLCTWLGTENSNVEKFITRFVNCIDSETANFSVWIFTWYSTICLLVNSQALFCLELQRRNVIAVYISMVDKQQIFDGHMTDITSFSLFFFFYLLAYTTCTKCLDNYVFNFYKYII